MNENDMGYGLGDIVGVLDKIGLDEYTVGTIQKIEPNTENFFSQDPDVVVPEFAWIYIRANNDILNVNVDPNIGMYWTVIESISPYLRLISKATKY